MSTYEREERYLKLLADQEFSVSDLAKNLFISEPTVRRDLVFLSKKGLIVRSKGKAKLNTLAPNQRIPFFLREQDDSQSKRIIAEKAASYIKDGYSIMLDASTTAYHIVHYLTNFKKIFVITSGAKTAISLATLGIPCLCTGGLLAPESLSYIGSDAEKILTNYNADICFFSCHGTVSYTHLDVYKRQHSGTAFGSCFSR